MRLLRVSFSSSPVTLLTYHPPPDGLVHPAPSQILPLSTSLSHQHHSLLLLSYLSGTRLLLVEPDQTADGQLVDMLDVSEELPLEVWEPTLACALISEGTLAQVRGVSSRAAPSRGLISSYHALLPTPRLSCPARLLGDAVAYCAD